MERDVLLISISFLLQNGGCGIYGGGSLTLAVPTRFECRFEQFDWERVGFVSSLLFYPNASWVFELQCIVLVSWPTKMLKSDDPGQIGPAG